MKIFFLKNKNIVFQKIFSELAENSHMSIKKTDNSKTVNIFGSARISIHSIRFFYLSLFLGSKVIRTELELR